jgi:hypothetical protein
MIERLLRQLATRGMDSVLNYSVGTSCPCRLYEDPDNPSYSPEWHRLNPSAENCNGNLVISSVSVQRNMKIFIGSITSLATLDTVKKWLEIGKAEANDFAAICALDGATNEVPSMEDWENDLSAYLQVDDDQFKLISVVPMAAGNEKYYLTLLRKL